MDIEDGAVRQEEDHREDPPFPLTVESIKCYTEI